MIYGSDGVDIPQELLDAQAKDKLALFVGAGVSVGPPSDLPSFPALVEKIALGAPAKLPDEPLDEYLGRLERDDVKIQELTRRFLTKPDSRPRQLHHDLVTLFGKWPAPRIVTTNCDPHFTACAVSRFGAGVRVYSAPALPLGSDFSGIVHLHGSLALSHDHLVLSDTDFGRAYVTEAWAAKFLVEMFQAYTVLFVGYSHNDPIMRYLTRGLPKESTSRFALTVTDDAAKWRSFGIVPIEYPKHPGPDRHAALDAAVADWAADTIRGAVDHAERLRQIAEGPPPTEPAIEDYVVSAFRNAARLQFVVNSAKSVEWLQWADDHKLLDAVFTQEGEAGKETRLLAGWIAEHYALEHPKAALAVARKHSLTICWPLWAMLAMRLGSPTAAPTPSVLSAWVVALLQAAPLRWSREPLGILMSACSRPEDVPSALLLMGELTRPELSRGPLRRGHIDGAIDLVGDPYDIARGWTSSLSPHMAIAAAPIEDFVTAHISHAHTLLQAVGLATPECDPVSYGRATIAPRTDGVPESSFGLLIDIARALLEWSLRERYETGQRLIDRWAGAEAPLLRRLALHGIAFDPHRDPDEALDLICSRGWLYNLWLKPEVFAVIAHAYPRATPEARAYLIQESMAAPVVPPERESPVEEADRLRDISDYERYNLAVWLARVAPDCALAVDHLATLQQAHQDYGPREYPNLSSSPVVVRHGPGPSPLTADEMLAKDPASLVDVLVSFSSDRSSFDAPTRWGLLSEMSEAATRSFEWGLRLATALAADDRVPDDVWQVLVGTWQKASVKDETDATLLAFFAAHPGVENAASDVVTLLLTERIESMPADRLPAAEELIGRLSKAVAENPDQEGRRTSTSAQPQLQGGSGLWLNAAINHPGGRIAQLWLAALIRRHNDSGSAWTGIPSLYRQWLESASSSDRQWGAMARVVIASRILFFFTIDRDWCRAVLLPSFNWDVDSLRAEQAWHGFAFYGEFSESLLADLMPCLRQCFLRLDSELQPINRDLSNKLAGVALGSSVDPLGSGWLSEFVRDGGDAARRNWAAEIGRLLRSFDASAVDEAWCRWMAEYWERRLMGVPRPLAPAEGAEMVEWMYGLAPVFPQAADKLNRSPIAFVRHRHVFTRLAESNLGIEHPAALASVLDRLLSFRERPFDECDPAEAIVLRLISATAPPATLRSICDSMIRLGCRRGVDLAKQIPNTP